MRSRMPARVSVCRRAERMLRAIPRLRCSSVKRRTPKNASRTIRKVQRSPRTSIARPIEHGSCCTMSPYRDGDPGLRRPQRRPATPPEPPVGHQLALRHTFAGVRKLLDLERAGVLRVVAPPQDLPPALDDLV